MSANNDNYFFKSTRFITRAKRKDLSGSAHKLYNWLNEVEQRAQESGQLYGDTPRKWFLCTDNQLHELTGMNVKTIQRAKKELKDSGLISVTRGKWHYSNGKSDISQPCRYSITPIEILEEWE